MASPSQERFEAQTVERERAIADLSQNGPTIKLAKEEAANQPHGMTSTAFHHESSRSELQGKEDNEAGERSAERLSARQSGSHLHGRRTSMYPELFQDMICTVLESESYLFSNAELNLLSSFFMLSYPARYLFVRLLQRKKDTWYRLDRLTAYEAEVGDLRPAKDELSLLLTEPSQDSPKVELARKEEEGRRKASLLDDKENVKLVLPGLQRELYLNEATGLPSTPSYHHRNPLRESKIPQNESPSVHFDTQLSGDSRHTSLNRFVLTERDMQGGTEESLSLLTIEELKILAKKLGITKLGTTRAQIISALTATRSQATLFSSPIKATTHTKTLGRSVNSGDGSGGQRQLTLSFSSSGKKHHQSSRLEDELSAVLGGGCIQVVPLVRSLVDRVALVYYRGNMLGSAALTTAVLSRSRIRNYPAYGFKRTSFLFPSRDHLIAFERALDIEARMEYLIQFGKTEADFRTALDLFNTVWDEWESCVQECTSAHPEGIDKMVYHRMRFHPGWVLTRVVYKGATILGRFKLHDREKEVLNALLDQKVFRRGRRGDWYDRLALITALYSGDTRRGKRDALEISVRGIQDPCTHLIYHDTLQRRIARLESQLKVPRSEQHDFSYAKLRKTTEVVFKGIRLDAMLVTDAVTTEPASVMSKFLQRGQSSSPDSASSKRPWSASSSPPNQYSTRENSGFQIRKPLFKRVKLEAFGEATKQERSQTPSEPVVQEIKREEDLQDISWDEITAPAPDATSLALMTGGEPKVVGSSTRRSMRSVWRGLDNAPCHVEQLCLQHYALQGFKGYHCEGKLLTMIFVLVMWDIMFQDTVPGSFETPYQSAPLDLGSDSFAIVRSAEIRERLSHVERTGGLDLIEAVDDRERELKTWAVGCRWDMFSKQDILEVAQCLGGHSISVICQMLAEEWDHCSSGMPDLVIWRMTDQVVRFVEVKGPGDRLSETQKVWIDILLRAGVEVQVGLVVEQDK